MSRKVIIECAVNGASKRSGNPSTPYTTEETIADALAACDAGASIIHYHVLGPQGEWRDDVDDYGAVIRGVRASGRIGAGALLWPTFKPGADVDERFGHFTALAADPETRPDLGACDMGSVNTIRWDVAKRIFSRTSVYVNSVDTCREALALMRRAGLKRSTLQIFGPTDLNMTLKFLELGILEEPLLLKFYLSGPESLRGFPLTPKGLEAYLDMVQGVKVVWFAACAGGDLTPLIPHVVSMGGHIRVGLEDFHYADQGCLTNAQQVARAAAIVRTMGCEVATPDETRRVLEI